MFTKKKPDRMRVPYHRKDQMPKKSQTTDDLEVVNGPVDPENPLQKQIDASMGIKTAFVVKKQGQMINRLLGATAKDPMMSKSLTTLRAVSKETFRKTETVIDGEQAETALFNQTVSQ